MNETTIQQLPSTGSTVVFLAILVIVAGIFTAAHVFSRPDMRARRSRNILIFGAGWFALTGLVPLARPYGMPTAVTIQTVAFVAIIVFIVTVSFSSYGKRIAFGLPIPFLTGLHIFRLPLELVLHQWWQEGFLPVQMTYNGDNFDILTGILALPVAFAAWRYTKILWPVWLFNIVGFFLLLRIIIIVNLSNPTPLKALIGGYPDGQEVLLGLYFPYIWIATVIVTVALFIHLVLFRRLIADSWGDSSDEH